MTITGVPRRYGSAGAYGKAMGMEQLPFWRRLTHHPAYDDYWQDQAVDRILGKRPLTVPTLLVGSLWDQEDIYGAAAVFDASTARPTRIWCSARGTMARQRGRRRARSARFGLDTGHWFRAKILIPFLDQQLKGAAGRTSRA